MNSPSDYLEVSSNDLIEKKGGMFKKYSRTPFTGCSVEYHENGQLEEKGTYRDDEKCGEWLEEGETVTYDPC